MDVITPYPTIEEVDNNLLKRFNELVEEANPEDLSKLLESWSKYISARKNNDILQQLSAEEKAEKETTAILEGLVK